MVYCLNPNCLNPENPDENKFCQICGENIPPLLRNRYQVIEPLGQGGFGKTYLAKDLDRLDKSCVVKQLVLNGRGTRATHKAVELFEREAKQLEKLGENNPHIPSLYAHFKQDGYLYLVQEFIDGQDLDKELEKRGTWQEKDIRKLLRKLLDVLHFIHENKVIHRDIKPANIMRCKASGKLVLIDFGVSKEFSETLIQNPDIKNDTNVGSLGYAPPEQMGIGQARPASDLFSLGVTCVHLLTKNYRHGWEDNWRQHSPSNISNELAGVIDNLLKKNFRDRYQSSEEALQDLLNPPSTNPVDQLSTNTLTAHHDYSPSTMAQTRVKIPKKLLVIGAILLVFISTQYYGWYRYKLSPFNQIFLITSLRSHYLLEGTLQGDSAPVNSVAFSPNGQILARGGASNDITLWNAETREEIVTLTGHSRSVRSVAFSPDTKILASGSLDGTIKLWDLQTRAKIATLSGHLSSINSVAFSPDGKFLASGGVDNTIKLWDLETKKAISTLTGHGDSVRVLAFSPDSKTLASASSDKTIKLWDLETKKAISTLTGHGNSVRALAFSPDSKTLASGGWDNAIKIWDVETKKAISTIIGHYYSVRYLAFSPDSKTLASASSDDTIKLWNVQTKKEIVTFTGHSSIVFSVAFSPDGKILVSGSEDETVKLWRMP